MGDPSAMVQEPVVLAVLGNTKQLRATSSPDLFNALQQYIDSKEKTSSKMEYWPLIKVVRVYCKASALSTGVVLVDLPGKHLRLQYQLFREIERTTKKTGEEFLKLFVRALEDCFETGADSKCCRCARQQRC